MGAGWERRSMSCAGGFLVQRRGLGCGLTNRRDLEDGGRSRKAEGGIGRGTWCGVVRERGGGGGCGRNRGTGSLQGGRSAGLLGSAVSAQDGVEPRTKNPRPSSSWNLQHALLNLRAYA